MFRLPRFDQTAVADAVSDWWIELLRRLTRVGVAGFRCLTLDLVPASFWRRLIATFPETLFLAWTPGVSSLESLAGVGFDLTCSSAGWWDGRASWFLDEQASVTEDRAGTGVTGAIVSRAVGASPAAGCGCCRLRIVWRLRIAASTGAGLFLPMGFEFATEPPV